MSTHNAPSNSQLADAREKLKLQQGESQVLSNRIADAQLTLAQIISDSERAIRALEDEKGVVEVEIEHTKAFLSPMRRLPDDIIQCLFWFEFEEAPCCAWVLGAVCSRWRRIVLNMPRMWSKMRLVTTLFSSPETIRLWLERSGQTVPLDIEIYLRVPHQFGTSAKRPGMVPTYHLPPLPPVLTPPPAWGMHPHTPPPLPMNGATPVASSSTTIAEEIPAPAGESSGSRPVGFGVGSLDTIPQLTFQEVGMISVTCAVGDPHHTPTSRRLAKRRAVQAAMQQNKDARVSPASWGHIAMFYLTEQMFRWKRFVFRFERGFESVAALKIISRDAPLLEEFEVSCGEPPRIKDFAEWTWLPNSVTHGNSHLPALRSVTINNLPFNASSPVFSSPSYPSTAPRSLSSLSLRATANLQTQHPYNGPGFVNNQNNQMTLNRLANLLSSHTSLTSLSLHFPANAIHPPILPLSGQILTLHELTSLTMAGGSPLTTLLTTLRLPALTSLSLALDRHNTVPVNGAADVPAQVLEEAISSLLVRSSIPPITSFTIAYPPIYYNDFGPGAPVPWAFFQHLPHVHNLRVSHASLEPLLSALGVPGVPGAPGMNDDDLTDDGMMPLGGGGIGIGGGAGGAGGGGGNNAWMLPELETLELHHCTSNQANTPYAYGQVTPVGVELSVKKLVELVGARNPTAAGGGAGGGNPLPIPVNLANGGAAGATSRIKTLKVQDCCSIGSDVFTWLNDRVEEFDFSFDPTPRHPRPASPVWSDY